VAASNKNKKGFIPGFRCTVTLKRRPTDCAGPPPIWVHVQNRVSGQPALDEAHPGGGNGAIMRRVFQCFRRPPWVEDEDGRLGHGAPAHSTSTSIQSEITTTQMGMRQYGKALDMFSWHLQHKTKRRHQICPPPHTCSALLLSHCL